MYYKVYNAISAISNVDDYGQSTRLLAATTLRYYSSNLQIVQIPLFAVNWTVPTSSNAKYTHKNVLIVLGDEIH